VYRTRLLGHIFSLRGLSVKDVFALHLVWAAKPHFFDQPLFVVALDEGSDGRADLFDVAECDRRLKSEAHMARMDLAVPLADEW